MRQTAWFFNKLLGESVFSWKLTVSYQDQGATLRSQIFLSLGGSCSPQTGSRPPLTALSGSDLALWVKRSFVQ